MQWTAILLGSICLLAHSGANSDSRQIKRDDPSNTFWTAVLDAVAGSPDAKSLRQRSHFEHAGIVFEYPAALRLTQEQLHRVGLGPPTIRTCSGGLKPTLCFYA